MQDGVGAVDVIYFDFMKAFDKVSYSDLIIKVELYGIGGPLLIWIRELLTDRKQRVAINGVESGLRSFMECHKAPSWDHYYVWFSLTIYLMYSTLVPHFTCLLMIRNSQYR